MPQQPRKRRRQQRRAFERRPNGASSHVHLYSRVLYCPMTPPGRTAAGGDVHPPHSAIPYREQGSDIRLIAVSNYSRFLFLPTANFPAAQPVPVPPRPLLAPLAAVPHPTAPPACKGLELQLTWPRQIGAVCVETPQALTAIILCPPAVHQPHQQLLPAVTSAPDHHLLNPCCLPLSTSRINSSSQR